MATNNNLPPALNQDPHPLSWPYARAKLRHILQTYVDESPPSKSSPRPGRRPNLSNNSPASQVENWLIAWAIENNVDLHAGSLLLSLSLLILACFSLTAAKDGNDKGGALNLGAGLHVYRGQLAASVLLLAGAIASFWIVQRNSFLCANDSIHSKKREIVKFLKLVREVDFEMGTATTTSSSVDGTSSSANTNNSNVLTFRNLPKTLSETAPCDIYPVYRQLSPGRFQWTRLPSLLLVEGDFVALQVGDISPADCCLVEFPEIQVKAGESVTLDAMEKDLIMAQLPRGRTSLPNLSENLLLVCSNIRIFKVQQAPIKEFIRRPTVPSRPSQVARKMRSIRAMLLILAPLFLLITLAIVLVRPNALPNDLSLSLSLPILAALGVSPLVAPSFVFFLEVVGTARILRTVHQHAVESQLKSEGEKVVVASTDGYNNGGKLLLLRYILTTALTRLSLWSIAGFLRRVWDRMCGSWLLHVYHRRRQPVALQRSAQRLVPIPPAGINLLEKLGVCTAFALVDDELAYEANAIPQQLLIPSGHGLKLLDLCPVYDDEEVSSDDSSGPNNNNGNVRSRGRSFEDSDSESEEEGEQRYSTLRQKILKRRVLRRRHVKEPKGTSISEVAGEGAIEVQFEDPMWWQYLPALKSIGLCCLLTEDAKVDADYQPDSSTTGANVMSSSMKQAKEALINLITVERRTHQLSALADCIGFSKEENINGPRGDLSPFEEQLRLQVISKPLLQERLSLDSHERSSEQSRWWGHLRADATSVIVKDNRTGAYQLLTVGDPHVVANLCTEAWQGEISTILPLGQIDRQTIEETSRNWKLADLDVAAFGYAPVPHSMEKRLKEDDRHSQVFLLDASSSIQSQSSTLKDKNASRDWALIRNQVFLGVLGSLVVPRREIPKLLGDLNDAGVRFVYFSPRNMRRQKELASQMGIDVAWNCAISLRPLEVGEEDPHRMVSTYADWDVNAKLPHGVDEVRKHLEEVDNVPLLVSLYTDTTKRRTKEMLEVFQDYHDTVLAIGIAHLPRNDEIFAAADIAVGIDVLGDKNACYLEETSLPRADTATVSPADRMAMAELEFVSAIASHSCAFRFRGVGSLSQLSSLIEQGRAALEATTSAGVFLLSSSLSFSFFVLFAACASSTTLPYVPAIGAVVYLQILLPIIGLSMALTKGGEETMTQVPPKNDSSQPFGPKEGFFLYEMLLLKSLMLAVPPQLLQLIAFGELVIAFEPDLVQTQCNQADRWYNVIRCEALKEYSGPARISAGIAVFAVFVMSSIVTSASFVSRFEPIKEGKLPWERNFAWLGAVLFSVVITIIAAILATEKGTAAALPWYFYIISIVIPVICLIWNEYWKEKEAKREIRAEKLRRLQFETRLGAWSPK
ncbi:hypothetical protein ACA910_013029 [Epithemia clementina (nom. ined.)]